MKHRDHRCRICGDWLNEDRGCDRCAQGVLKQFIPPECYEELLGVGRGAKIMGIGADKLTREDLYVALAMVGRSMDVATLRRDKCSEFQKQVAELH